MTFRLRGNNINSYNNISALEQRFFNTESLLDGVETLDKGLHLLMQPLIGLVLGLML